MGSGLRELLQSEYAFGELARTSVRTAFLNFLAEDSLVLQPGPVSGRAFYRAAPESKDQLDWYPTAADVAGSDDLGFSSGPWVYTAAASGGRSYGHFLSLWKRDPQGRWRVEFDAGIAHGAPALPERKLEPDTAPATRPPSPPARLIAADAVNHAIDDCQVVALENGLSASLRTYARLADYRLYFDGEMPMAVDAAAVFLEKRPRVSAWKEVARRRSTDSTLAYTVGEMTGANDKSGYAYAQIWQYDARVSNWGLRALLMGLLPATAIKS